jgi:hypothetical protein
MRTFLAAMICLMVSSWLVPQEVIAQQGSIASVYGEALNNQMAQGLVACQGLNCDFCEFAATVNNVINWLFGFLTLVAVLIFVYAGFRLVTSNGNTDVSTWAKQRFAYIFIGLLLMLASWLIIDTILRGLTGRGMNVWGTFDVTECGSMVTPVSVRYNEYMPTLEDLANESETGASLNYRGTGVVADTSNMVSLRDAGVLVADWHGINGPGRTDLAHPTAVAAARRMQDLAVQRYGQAVFQVTAAYTEGVGHSAGSRHYQGIAIDFDPINGANNATVAALAREVGFTFVLDEGSHIHADMRQLSNVQ